MDETSNLITNWGYANLIAAENEAAAGRRRRLDLTIMEQYELVSVENTSLQRTKHKLIDENVALRVAFLGLLDRADAFRRVVEHLRTAWQPQDAIDATLKDDMDPLIDRKLSELHVDATWPAEREKIATGWVAWGKAQPRPAKK